MLAIRHSLMLALLLGCGACSPTFDWRLARPDPALQIYFPCRPTSLTREVNLAGHSKAMQLTSCSTGGLTFGVARFDAGDAARVAPLMQHTRDALAANLASPAGAQWVGTTGITGVAPSPGDGRYRVTGTAPDGGLLSAHALLFAHAGVVYQATVIGANLDPEVVEQFFESVRVAG